MEEFPHQDVDWYLVVIQPVRVRADRPRRVMDVDPTCDGRPMSLFHPDLHWYDDYEYPWSRKWLALCSGCLASLRRVRAISSD